MPQSVTSQDPDGHYARLRVEPSADADTISAAYRREARLVHPDVPGTGDAIAFVALKRAYDVLNHPARRAAYDRFAQREAERYEARMFGEIDPTPFPELKTPTRHPRLTDLPTAVWAVMAVVLSVGVIEIGQHLMTPSAPVRHETIPATARAAPPLPPNELGKPMYGPAPVRLAGTPNFYVVPTAAAAMLWRADDAKRAMVPWGQLPAFSAVQALRLLKPSGLVEVKVTESANGFIEAGRLTPGDAAAASRAWCTFNAGPPPSNGEVLTRGGDGKAKMELSNRSGQPAVVKFRDNEGTVLASIFLGPGGEATVDGLPEQAVKPEYATGEVWSRACHGFAAGMRAWRLADSVTIGTVARLAIPPDRGTSVGELSDPAFERQ